MILVLCLWFPVLFCILPSCVVCYFSFPAIVSFSLLFSCCLHLHCLSLLPVSLAFPAHHLFGVIFPHLCCSTSLRMHLLMSVCVHSPLCSLLSLSVHSLFSYFSPVWLLCFTWAYSSLRYISVLLFLLFFFFYPLCFHWFVLFFSLSFVSDFMMQPCIFFWYWHLLVLFSLAFGLFCFFIKSML